MSKNEEVRFCLIASVILILRHNRRCNFLLLPSLKYPPPLFQVEMAAKAKAAAKAAAGKKSLKTDGVIEIILRYVVNDNYLSYNGSSIISTQDVGSACFWTVSGKGKGNYFLISSDQRYLSCRSNGDLLLISSPGKHFSPHKMESIA
jgi:hypothetical protein